MCRRIHWGPLLAALLLLWASGVGCSDSPQKPEPPTPSPIDSSLVHYGYRVIATYPHDSGAFTQGLAYRDSLLIEGTGYYRGPSTLRRVEIETGTVVQSRNMPDAEPAFFGEGVTVWDDRVIQLTWLHNVAVVYNEETFAEIGRFSYPTQGWGLTHDGTRFIMSDGTDTLYYRDPVTFAEIGRVAVKDSITPVTELNELEYIDGLIYANVYLTNFIVMISPASGRVVGIINLTGLLNPYPPGADVLNGIAYDTDRKRLLVTGKLWPYLFEIELVPED
jgi:glutamine cyclotransferase